MTADAHDGERVVGHVDLRNLHTRHRLAPGLALSLFEAACVCLHRHHTSPSTLRVIAEGQHEATYRVDWVVPTPSVQRSYANDEDATEYGAYCVSIAAAESHLGLWTIGRARQGSGSDFLLVGVRGAGINPDDGELDFDQSGIFRLEVSGIDRCDNDTPMLYRLSQKVEQAKRGKSFQPGIACVVAFSIRRVMFRKV